MKNLLYVEDDAINAFVLRKLLNGIFNVVHVLDGESCMEQVAENKFDGILMDINLGKGKMDGVQTLHKLRELQQAEPFIIIAVTSYALPEDRERFLQEGFDAYMSKPLNRQELIDLLNLVLGQ